MSSLPILQESDPRSSTARRHKSSEKEPANNDKGHETRYRDSNPGPSSRYKSRKDEYSRDIGEYDERRRERERIRDRDRYDDGRNRGNYSPRRRRRSASPQSQYSRTREREHDTRSISPDDKTSADKLKPNFAPSGLLAAETKTVKAVDGTSTVLKYHEPPEARKPLLGWRLYVFKDSEQVELLHIHRQSAYLVGRDRLVADIALEHPSCSKQHAVFQYRYVQEQDEFGASKGVVKPYVIDLESTNGTFVNDEQIPPSRYYELAARDVIKFGLSTREYVLLHDEAS